MSWPSLVPASLCKTQVSVVLYAEDIDEDGDRIVAYNGPAACNWQGSAKIVQTDQTHSVQLSAVALFPGDLCPGLAAITSGTITVFGERRDILRGMKARNPDGTVNYTRLEVV